MSLPIPKLDDKRFDDLAEESRKLIPIHAPRWTDHNLHDPGVTLIHLFAWLTEMHLYSLDQVTDAHLLKYLELLGREPRAAVPSQVSVELSADEETPVPAGTLFSTRPDGGGMLFESTESIDILPLTIKRVVKYADYRYTDVTAFNSQAHGYYPPFGETPGVGDALYIGFQPLAVLDDLEGKSLQLAIFNYEDDLPPAGQGETVDGENPLLDFPVTPSASAQWEYRRNDNWPALSIGALTPTVPIFSVDGVVTLHLPEDLQFGLPENLSNHVSEADDYIWVRCRLTAGQYELPPRIDRIIPNVVPAVAVPPEPDPENPVTFFGGTIEAGSLVHCTIPGAAGDVEVAVVNPYASTPGREAQTIDHVFTDIRKNLDIPCTAVTASDYETIVKAVPGLRVARAEAVVVPGHVNHVTIAVVPYSFDPIPIPGDGFKQTICRYLDAHRPVTTRITVCAADYVKVSVNVSVTLKSGAAPQQVERDIRSALDRFLSPLSEGGGDSVAGGAEGWPFGRPVYRSEVLQLLENVDGVLCISRLILGADAGRGIWQLVDGNIVIGRLSLVYPGSHQIEVDVQYRNCVKVEGNHE